MKKNKLIIAIVAAIVVVALLIFLFFWKKNSDSDKSTDPSATSTPISSSDSESKEPEVQTYTDPITDNTNSSVFPFAIPNTQLEVLNVGAYDGLFLEDGSDDEISGVAALVLRNCGKAAVEYVSISMTCGNTSLEFEGSDIPSGAMIVLQDTNRTPFSSGAISNCSATVAELDKLEMSENAVLVTENSDNTLTIKNITNKALPCVRVFYKFYSGDEGSFVGGITYVAKITDLQPDEAQTILPSHYVTGYSVITMVRTYDTYETQGEQS